MLIHVTSLPQLGSDRQSSRRKKVWFYETPVWLHHVFTNCARCCVWHDAGFGVSARCLVRPRVCMCVSGLCLYLETGKVCRSKSLRKAALIPSCAASTWDGCKWKSAFFFSFLFFLLGWRPQTKGERCPAGSQRFDHQTKAFVGVHIFLLGLSRQPYQTFFLVPIDWIRLFDVL